MVKKEDPSKPPANLRRRAEEMILAEEAEARGSLSPMDPPQLLHELRVHQIELEMQNEELRRAQEELEASRARYFDLYDLAPVGYFTMNEEGMILEANLTIATLLEVARGELAKQPFSHFILPDDQDIFYRHRKQLFETGAPQVCEMRLLRADKVPFWARIEATLAEDAEGGPPLCRAVVSNITELRRAEEKKTAVEAQNRQLQKAESLGRMAGGIAHHFNNQLLAVLGNLELALEDLPPDANLAEKLTEAMQAARKASEMSRQMLTYLGQSPAKLERLDLSKACRQFLPILQVALPKGVVLETDLPSSGPVVNANAYQIQQVLANLVTNAWESFGDRRGAIHLNLKTVSRGNIPASNRFPVGWVPRDSVYACLEVADAGCGIPTAELDRIFDPFFSSKLPGRGLGLAVVLGIVRAHGGALTLESEPGRGSIFRVFFPLSAEEVPQLPESTAHAPELEARGTVLLVEDEPHVRKMVATMLSRRGFRVLAAQDGVEAVDVFRQHKDEIHCVLLDLTMPRMGGWETLVMLRIMKRGIPVIMASGYDESQVMTGDHPEWPQAFLSKPYQLDELHSKICQLLADRK